MTQTKQSLRKEIAAAIGAITPEERRQMDEAVNEQAFEFFSMMMLTPSAPVLAYLPLRDEVDIVPLLMEFMENDVVVAMPRIEGDRLVLHEVTDIGRDVTRGSFDVPEPKAELPIIPIATVSVVITPGRAFTQEGDRLGRGKGYYDRLLKLMPARRVALAYDCQVLDSIPVTENDEKIDLIITPTRKITVEGRWH